VADADVAQGAELASFDKGHVKQKQAIFNEAD
jgi:hypothetical protein